jgi:hypothetical protein
MSAPRIEITSLIDVYQLLMLSAGTLMLSSKKVFLFIFHCYCLYYYICMYICDRLCGLVVRVLGYRSGGPGSISGTTRKEVVGLERGPLSLQLRSYLTEK